MKTFKVTEKAFKFRRIAILAFCLMFFDALMMGIPAFGLSISFFLMAASGLSGLIYLSKDKRIALLYAKKAAIYLCGLLGIIVIFKINAHIGKSNAKVIISAVDAYYQDVGVYPKRLKQLVPKYLEKIPRCAYRMSGCQYRYISSEKSHLLMWQEIPPFGDRTYSFERAKWGYID